MATESGPFEDVIFSGKMGGISVAM